MIKRAKFKYENRASTLVGAFSITKFFIFNLNAIFLQFNCKATLLLKYDFIIQMNYLIFYVMIQNLAVVFPADHYCQPEIPIDRAKMHPYNNIKQ